MELIRGAFRRLLLNPYSRAYSRAHVEADSSEEFVWALLEACLELLPRTSTSSFLSMHKASN